MSFPEGFIWGTSSSAHQVEGNNEQNQWWKWEREKNVPKSGTACKHYDKYEEDIDLMSDLGYEAYRFSIEWSRIEPEEGNFDRDEIQHYRDLVDYARKKDVEPIPMLWHYTNPIWFMKKGGWLEEENIGLFLDFVKKIAEEFEFNYWLTIDEPMVYARQTCANPDFPPAYLCGDDWPTRKNNLNRILKLGSNLLKAHSRSYDIIRKNSSGKIGFSKAINAMKPASESPLDEWTARTLDYIENEIWLRSLEEGELLPPFSPTEIGDCLDFFGLNYFYGELGYFDENSTDPPYFFFQRRKNKDTLENEMGWWTYPDGLLEALRRVHQKLEKPIMITSNGIGTCKDSNRREHIVKHLERTSKALQEDINVIGYLHWSFLDNFEWDHGFEPHFGLVEVDYESMERTPRKSAYLLGDIAAKNKITEKIREKYIPSA